MKIEGLRNILARPLSDLAVTIFFAALLGAATGGSLFAQQLVVW